LVYSCCESERPRSRLKEGVTKTWVFTLAPVAANPCMGALFSPRKILGISLYFVGVGFWVIVLLWVSVWGLLVLLPALVLAFAAGYMTNFFARAHEWPSFKHFWLWESARTQYFNFTLCGDDDGVALMQRAMSDEGLGSDERVLWAIYPHGHYSLTAMFWWAVNPRFKRCLGAIHSAIFYVPLFGAIAGWVGAISVNETCMKNTLTRGDSVFMCPGGVSDIVNVGTDIKKRRGFIRVAKETGAILVPIWCADERSYYTHWLPLGFSLERFLFFPVPIFIWGRWWCPLAPNRPSQSRIYVGRPIRFPVDSKDVDGLFWAEMERLQQSAQKQDETERLPMNKLSKMN